MVREAIEAAVREALAQLGAGEASFVVERPRDMAHGDYATNAALAAAKLLKKDPKEVAEQLLSTLSIKEGIEKIEVAGAGFINFYLSADAIRQEVSNARGDEWGHNDLYKGKTVMVEYTDPNPFKEFHIGHLVPNALGESLARLFESSRATVKRANWQGDVGVHVAKSLFILLEKGIESLTIADLSAAYPEGSSRYDTDPEAKAAIDTLNKKIYERTDPRVNDLYDKGKALSLAQFEEIYKVLGTKFDYYFFESDGGPKGAAVVRAHPELFPESEGAIIFPGEKYGLHTRVFINRQGLPTYEAKEIGLALMKREACDFDLTVTVTGNEQAEYFKVVMKAMELALPELKGKLACKTNGMLRFAQGKMSSRLGNIVRGEDLINDLKEVAEEKMNGRDLKDPKKTAEQIAVGAIKYQILKQTAGKDIIFDKESALSFEGDSGPYLQYARVRALSLLRGAKEAGVDAGTSDASRDVGVLERTLLHYPEAAARAAREMEPHYVTTYLTELASAFNSWYAQEKVIGGPHQHYGVLLTEAFEKVMSQGLNALGIPAPEEM